MSWIKPKLAALFLSLALVTTPAWSEQPATQQSHDKSTAGHLNKDNENNADQPDKISGKVLRVREISARDSNENYRLAFVETSDGQKIAVDLGPVSGLKNAGLNEGDQISAIGSIEMSGGKPVFVADEARIGGKTVEINRPDEAEARPNANQDRNNANQEEPPQFKFTGKIIDHDLVSVSDSDVKHTVAVIQTTEGKKLLADLGPADQVNPELIDKNDQVTVLGHGVKISGRPILIAEKLKIGGKKLNVMQQEEPKLKMFSDPAARDLKRQQSKDEQALPKTVK